ncbi:MAG: ABC transporter ATP-binding protein [Candidatus Bathyarchaeota archaeon]|nr:ABC transporter ATP-binding protein [Candidatus Bathyarchaeota archaeon]MDH5779012.1 ABC transporter ATP-binding protein [Candidatus Bathyarchaeota archaeon]
MIETQNLKKRYRMGDVDVSALNGVDLRVETGEFMSIMGPSGSGKTTLLNLIGALDRPTEGKVRIKGTDISKLNDDELAELRNREIGFVFQFFNLVARMSALKNVEMPMAFAGVSPDERKRRATELLESVGLGDRIDHRPTELSGGEQQRVAIARALVNNPSVVLCDEPTGNVDSKTGKEVMEILRKLNREQQQTFVIVTHDPLVAESVDRIAHMQDGVIIREETIR